MVDAILPYLLKQWANPSSAYRIADDSRRAVESARESVAKLLGANPDQVVFTSSATEANNAALQSAALRSQEKRHILTSQVEHSSILQCCANLERAQGCEVTRLPVEEDGSLDPALVEDSIREDTTIVALMAANNETGVVWPFTDFSEICNEKGVPLHIDAVQAVGKIPLDVEKLAASSVAISGHKIGATTGVGALVLPQNETFEPLIHGGKQERGRRAGTENVPAIVGLGRTAEISMKRGTAPWERVRALRDRFEERIAEEVPKAAINGGGERLPNTSNVHLPGIDSDAAVTFLDQRGICVSSGSACLESALSPSHVVMAMTGSHERASESLRISLGLHNCEEEIEQVLRALSEFSELTLS